MAKTPAPRPVLVESRTLTDRDGFLIYCDEAIVDHSEHGRLYLREGWCGFGQLCGEAYRWRGGQVWRVHPTDTLKSLSVRADEDGAVEDEDDEIADSRTQLDWPGAAIEKLAKSVGL